MHISSPPKKIQSLAIQLPANQQNFRVKAVHLRVDTRPGVAADGIDLRILGPNAVDAAVTTDAAGIVSTENAALAGLINSDPLADWQVSVVGGAEQANVADAVAAPASKRHPMVKLQVTAGLAALACLGIDIAALPAIAVVDSATNRCGARRPSTVGTSTSTSGGPTTANCGSYPYPAVSIWP